MENFDYRSSAIDKIAQTRKILTTLAENHPKDKTLEIFKNVIIERMGFIYTTLSSWYSDDIDDRWDNETISSGKAACIGNIDSLEPLVKDVKDKINNQRQINGNAIDPRKLQPKAPQKSELEREL